MRITLLELDVLEKTWSQIRAQHRCVSKWSWIGHRILFVKLRQHQAYLFPWHRQVACGGYISALIPIPWRLVLHRVLLFHLFFFELFIDDMNEVIVYFQNSLDSLPARSFIWEQIHSICGIRWRVLVSLHSVLTFFF
jgi:hypothetical protein